MRARALRVKCTRFQVALMLALLHSRTAFAEVMDKEASVVEIWSWSLIFGVIGLIGWPTFWPVAVAGAVLGAFLFAGVFSELASFDVGPAILREAGDDYPLHAWAALALLVALQVAGMVLRWRRVRARDGRTRRHRAPAA